ncbi:hypothetical protein IFT80_04805 [Pseudomonas sp. CFBP 8771]|uniref:hypothetical protein n=1 Tax=Pseudomonas sp. CFBP 8771 TaxID=2775285 RepID=UPI00177D1C49|nr:hypothetical protein [Pseudomonas sp. CFBP 8771]MBD8601958.1 hypothetical protein [Pseudomonas sp. CFBP 8771]
MKIESVHGCNDRLGIIILKDRSIEVTYEKMYAYEEDIKNSISIKTQLIFTAIFALLSVSAYLARFLDFTESPVVAYVIASLILLVIVIISVSVYFNCRAFSGSEFNRMPYAAEVKKYHDDQVGYNSEVKKYNCQVGHAEQLDLVDPIHETESYISETYVRCATHNALVNEQRSRWVFKSVAAFLIACIPLVLASLLFVVFDMDTSSPRKSLSIRDSYVGDEISSLKGQLLAGLGRDQIADLEKRTIILENAVLAMRLKKLSESEKATAEQQSKPPAPVKPAAPPRRMTLDEAPPGERK